jgi:hypothetical protein
MYTIAKNPSGLCFWTKNGKIEGSIQYGDTSVEYCYTFCATKVKVPLYTAFEMKKYQSSEAKRIMGKQTESYLIDRKKIFVEKNIGWKAPKRKREIAKKEKEEDDNDGDIRKKRKEVVIESFKSAKNEKTFAQENNIIVTPPIRIIVQQDTISSFQPSFPHLSQQIPTSTSSLGPDSFFEKELTTPRAQRFCKMSDSPPVSPWKLLPTTTSSGRKIIKNFTYTPPGKCRCKYKE